MPLRSREFRSILTGWSLLSVEAGSAVSGRGLQPTVSFASNALPRYVMLVPAVDVLTNCLFLRFSNLKDSIIHETELTPFRDAAMREGLCLCFLAGAMLSPRN